MEFFTDFTLETIDLTDGPVRLRRSGDGPPLICLHGNPQTHAMWHLTAPALAETHSVYCPDLRGYGVSQKPPHTGDHAPYSKRAMAGDVVALMDHFAIESAVVVSHDRGARAAHRLALDHPDRVSKLVVMDIVPTLEHFERTDMAFAMAYAHWFYLAMPAPVPEKMIANDPVGWFQGHTGRTSAPADLFAPDALDDYLEHIRNPVVIRGICEDYRAAATIDLDHDRESRAAGEKIKCPLLALWGDKGIIGKFYDPLALWQTYAVRPVTGGSVPSGHYLPEEAPQEVLHYINDFLGAA